MEEKKSKLEWTDGDEKNASDCIIYVDPQKGVAGVKFSDGSSGRFQVPLKDLVDLDKRNNIRLGQGLVFSQVSLQTNQV